MGVEFVLGHTPSGETHLQIRNDDGASLVTIVLTWEDFCGFRKMVNDHYEKRMKVPSAFKEIFKEGE